MNVYPFIMLSIAPLITESLIIPIKIWVHLIIVYRVSVRRLIALGRGGRHELRGATLGRRIAFLYFFGRAA